MEVLVQVGGAMVPAVAEETDMSRKWQLAIGGIVVAIILWVVGIPWWAPVLLILAALAVPIIGYMMLDSNQKRRIRRMRSRGQIGR